MRSPLNAVPHSMPPRIAGRADVSFPHHLAVLWGQRVGSAFLERGESPYISLTVTICDCWEQAAGRPRRLHLGFFNGAPHRNAWFGVGTGPNTERKLSISFVCADAAANVDACNTAPWCVAAVTIPPAFAIME
jgi:hypothetical protein